MDNQDTPTTPSNSHPEAPAVTADTFEPAKVPDRQITVTPPAAIPPAPAEKASEPGAKAPAKDSRPITSPIAATGPRRSVLSRVLSRETPRPPFVGKRLGRSEVMQLLAVAADTGRQGAIDLRGADLRGADLTHLDLANARFGEGDPLATEEERRDLAARLDGAHLDGANLTGISANGVRFDGVRAHGACFADAQLAGASFTGAYLVGAVLTGARLTEANLAEATLTDARLDNAVLVGAQLPLARLRSAHLAGTDLGLCNLTGADLSYAVCDEQTFFGGALLQEAHLQGMRLREMDLTAVDWTLVQRTGEERVAHETLSPARTAAFRTAARVYRRLGLTLRGQGLMVESIRFTARARLMDQHAVWAEMRERLHNQHTWPAVKSGGRWLLSASEGVITGYGAHPSWAIAWAAAVGVLWSVLYLWLGPHGINPGAAFLLSGSSLLGRGYTDLPSALLAPGALPVLSVVEAAIGTVLELLFVIALARRTLG